MFAIAIRSPDPLSTRRRRSCCRGAPPALVFAKHHLGRPVIYTNLCSLAGFRGLSRNRGLLGRVKQPVSNLLSIYTFTQTLGYDLIRTQTPPISNNTTNGFTGFGSGMVKAVPKSINVLSSFVHCDGRGAIHMFYHTSIIPIYPQSQAPRENVQNACAFCRPSLEWE